MKRAKPLDLFLRVLAIGAAAAVLLRRSDKPRRAKPGERTAPPTGKEWAGSVLRTMRGELRDDETVVIAAALSFYTMLAIIPAVFAAVTIYALVLDPADVADQIETVAGALPDSFRSLVADEIQNFANRPNTGLGLGAVTAILGTLWVASGGVRALLHGINIVYNVEERRPWLVQRAMAYGLTVGGIVFGLSTVALVTFLPDWLQDLGLGVTGVRVIQIARWPAIFLVVVLGLTVLYRIAPNLPRDRRQVLYPGAFAASVLWLLATLGFSFYTGSGLSSFDSATYGTLTSIVVVLVWFFISGFLVLLGAELNATLESNPRRR